MALPPTAYEERWAPYQAILVGLLHGGARAQELHPQFEALIKPLQHLDMVLRVYPLPDYIRGLLLKDHDLLYKQLCSVKLTYSHGNAAGNFLEANRATGKDKEDLLAIAAAAKGGHRLTTPRAGPKTRRPLAKSNIICQKCNKVGHKAAVCRGGGGAAK
jgi:hypothetical protein